jgi:single-strand DNA-binding protein
MALYENTVKLKGFLGKDAQSQSTRNSKTFTILSLATKSSYKDKEKDEWISRTEWHRIVCFGKPGDYAKDLKKGDYIDVQGELRSSEFDAEVGKGKKKATVKRRSWEIRAIVVRKLARIQDQDADFAPEESAA